ncbi:hypothetical protein [Pseudomonas sp. Marseille-Q5115]|nr:hypothetical protein [Pseudomonas sp. Marseille-Q5115]
MSALHALGLLEHFADISWAGLYALAVLPVAAGLYALGFGLAHLCTRQAR